jgi:hypothetical protein
MGKKPTDSSVVNIGALRGDDAIPVARLGLFQANRTTPDDLLAYMSDNGLGGGGVYTNLDPVPTGLGGITAGTTFDGVAIADVLDNLLYPYQAPAFSSFSFPQATTVEVGTAISGVKTFTWTITNVANVDGSGVTIRDTTQSTVLALSILNDGTEALDIGSIVKTASGSHSWSITGTNTHAVSFSRSFGVSWQWKKFYGESVSAELTEEDVKALRVSGLSSSFSGTYSFAAGGYKWLAYPTNFGLASTFKDQSTNLDIPFESAVSLDVVNTQGSTATYRLHRSTNVLGAAISIGVS